jgi:hypothetical protein
MTHQRRVRVWAGPIPAFLGELALLVLVALGARAQEQPSTPTQGPQKTTTLKTGITYEDQSSESCEKQNENNPYTGMDPLTCYGVMAPTDSRGQCSLGGMKVWKQQGNTCYYCSPITSPPNTIIVPMDQVGAADNQGFRCGEDQADACMAICSGGNTYTPPLGTKIEGGGPGLPPTPAPKEGGPPPNYAPMPGPAGGIGYVPGANPCLPFGPGGYDYCQNGPGARLPAGCECSKNPAPKQTPAKKPQTNPIADAGNYLRGVVDGFGGCLQGLGNGIGSLMAGAGFFAQGDFVNAAKAWGLSPGQSIVLKGMYAEMTTPVVGQNISPYQQGVTAGRRLCAYAAIPGTVKAIGTVAGGAVSPGSTFTNPIKGGALQDAINSAPKTIANKWVQTPKGPVQLGAYSGQGSFASVFKYGKASVMKLSRSNPETMGYGPESLEGQATGAGRVSGAGVETPNVSNLEPGGTSQPSTLVADNVAQKYPGAFQLSNAEYHRLTPAQQGAVLNAVDNAANQIAGRGYVLLDVNPGNFSLQNLGNAMKAILHDPDMVMTVDEIRNLAPNSVPRGVLNYALDVAGQPEFLNQPFTAQSLTNVLNVARERLITGITNVSGSTVKPLVP